MAFSFVHTADLHLDCPFGGLRETPPQLASILRESTFSALDRVVDLCIEHRAAFLVVAGDVYNAKDKSLRAQLRFREALLRLADAGTASFVAFGNHDPKTGWSAALDWPDCVHMFPSGKPSSFPVVCRGEQIATVTGVSYSRSEVTENLASEYTPPEHSPFRVAVLHCNCGQVSDYEPYSPCTIDDLTRSGFDYWALGHIHKRAILHGQRPTVAYPGNTQGLNPKEDGAKGCYVLKVGDDGSIDAEFAETDAVRWISTEVNLSGMASEQDLLNALQKRIDEIRKDSGRPTLIRITLGGRTSLHPTLRRQHFLSDMVEEISDTDCRPEEMVWTASIRDATLPNVDISERRKSEDFLGDFLRAVQAAREDPHKLAQLLPALEPLFQDRRASRILREPSDEQLLAWLDEAETCGLDALLAGGDE
jgi:DNA repair exonuclease SbcCD nuclease subunit